MRLHRSYALVVEDSLNEGSDIMGRIIERKTGNPMKPRSVRSLQIASALMLTAVLTACGSMSPGEGDVALNG